MKNKLYNHLIIIINVLLLIELFINKTLIINTIGYSLNIWITSIIPSLFPIFIISELLINYNIINYIPKVIINIIIPKNSLLKNIKPIVVNINIGLPK